MPLTRPHRLDFWDQCVQELRARRSRFRLRRDPGSPFVYIREVHGGAKVREFSLRPLQCDHNEDVEEARDLCLEAHRKGRWPIHPSQQQPGVQHTWSSLVEACVVDIELRIAKEGSRVHAINDLRKRIARFRDPVDPQQLQTWAQEKDPLRSLKSFNRRIETLSQIHRSGLLDLGAVLEQLRAMRPKGAAEKVRKASAMRVRVIPSDEDLQTSWIAWTPSCSGCSRRSPPMGSGPTSYGMPQALMRRAGSPSPVT